MEVKKGTLVTFFPDWDTNIKIVAACRTAAEENKNPTVNSSRFKPKIGKLSDYQYNSIESFLFRTLRELALHFFGRYLNQLYEDEGARSNIVLLFGPRHRLSFTFGGEEHNAGPPIMVYLTVEKENSPGVCTPDMDMYQAAMMDGNPNPGKPLHSFFRVKASRHVEFMCVGRNRKLFEVCVLKHPLPIPGDIYQVASRAAEDAESSRPAKKQKLSQSPVAKASNDDDGDASVLSDLRKAKSLAKNALENFERAGEINNTDEHDENEKEEATEKGTSEKDQSDRNTDSSSVSAKSTIESSMDVERDEGEKDEEQKNFTKVKASSSSEEEEEEQSVSTMDGASEPAKPMGRKNSEVKEDVEKVSANEMSDDESTSSADSSSSSSSAGSSSSSSSSNSSSSSSSSEASGSTSKSNIDVKEDEQSSASGTARSTGENMDVEEGEQFSSNGENIMDIAEEEENQQQSASTTSRSARSTVVETVGNKSNATPGADKAVDTDSGDDDDDDGSVSSETSNDDDGSVSSKDSDLSSKASSSAIKSSSASLAGASVAQKPLGMEITLKADSNTDTRNSDELTVTCSIGTEAKAKETATEGISTGKGSSHLSEAPAFISDTGNSKQNATTSSFRTSEEGDSSTVRGIADANNENTQRGRPISSHTGSVEKSLNVPVGKAESGKPEEDADASSQSSSDSSSDSSSSSTSSSSSSSSSSDNSSDGSSSSSSSSSGGSSASGGSKRRETKGQTKGQPLVRSAVVRSDSPAVASARSATTPPQTNTRKRKRRSLLPSDRPIVIDPSKLGRKSL